MKNIYLKATGFYFFLLFFASHLCATEYYIDKSGSDSNPGTAAKPWLTIGKANATLKAGDTVFIKDGEYQEQIKPVNSGQNGSYITYKAFQGAQPILSKSPAKRAIELTDRSYINVDGIGADGKAPWDSSNLEKFVVFFNSNYNIIQNGSFKYAKGWAALDMDGGSHHNKILNNSFDHVGTWLADPNDPKGGDKGEIIEIYCAYNNLIEGNTFTRGGHGLVTINGYENVVRNNSFNNKWGEGKGNRAATITSRPSKGCPEKVGFNVFEGNIIFNTLPASDQPTKSAAVKVEGINHIVRGNFLYDNFNMVFSTNSISYCPISQYNKIYHNTIYNNGGVAWDMRHLDTGNINDDNIFKNNIVYMNRQNPPSSSFDYEFKYDINIDGDPLDNNLVTNNAVYSGVSGGSSISVKSIGIETLSWYENKYANNFNNNVEVAAEFVSSNPKQPEDFNLKSGSALIDAAAFLTRTVSSGSGKVIGVKDAGYFFNGYGIVDGDRIQVGGNAPVRVTGVDYKNNTLTVDSSISWQNGDGVSLPYNGSAPDIGAREFGDEIASSSRPSAPDNIKLIIVN